MKKIAIILISIVAVSMMLMAAAPVFAARTPRANQVFVKVVDTAGNPIAKANVLLYEGNDWWTKDASTSWVVARKNGMAVISLTRDTNWGTWSSATIFSVDIFLTNYGTSYHFYDYPFSSTLSASIEVTVPV